MEELYKQIRHNVYQNLDIARNITDDELYSVIDSCIYDASRQKIISIRQKEELRNRIYNSIKKLDILQELLENPDITEITKNKKRVIVLNKSDLADENESKKWVDYFKKQGVSAVITDSNTGKGVQNVIKEIENLNLETLLMIILTIVFTLISVKFVLLSAKITKNFLVLEGTVLLVLVTIVLNYINVSWTSISTKLNLLMVIISIL